jgi:hypothetical protein
MKIAAMFITISCIFMMYVSWGTPAVYGWLVGLTGWLPHVFDSVKGSEK